MNIILYLLQCIKYLYQQNCWLILFICKFIPLKQWAYEDSKSPKYQKFKVDELPKVVVREKWDYKDFIPYLKWRYCSHNLKSVDKEHLSEKILIQLGQLQILELQQSSS